MLAVFKTGGKQYSVEAGQILKVEKLEGKKGENISFKDVLAVSDTSKHTIGTPIIEGAVVEAKIIDQIRANKIIVFKKRRRQNYRSTQGHRQYLTVLKIESITLNGKKIASKKEVGNKELTKKEKKEPTKKTVAKKATTKKTTVTKKTTKKNTKKSTVKKGAK